MKITFTNNEQRVLQFLMKSLKPWFGKESYSWVQVSDISNSIGKSNKSVRGILGSLAKKNVVCSYTGCGIDTKGKDADIQVFLFVGQEEKGFDGFTYPNAKIISNKGN